MPQNTRNHYNSARPFHGHGVGGLLCAIVGCAAHLHQVLEDKRDGSREAVTAVDLDVGCDRIASGTKQPVFYLEYEFKDRCLIFQPTPRDGHQRGSLRGW